MVAMQQLERTFRPSTVVGQQHQFTIFNYHVYRHDVYGVYIDIIILKVITIRHERITTRHK